MLRNGRTKRTFGLVLRGFAMGLAEVLPGISGGTVALITGIYDELVTSLAKLTGVVTKALRLQRVDFRDYTNALLFLLTLAAGMVVGVFLSATAIVWLLERLPMLVWGVVFGVVFAAIFPIARSTDPRYLMAYAPLGFLIACVLVFLPTSDQEPALLLILAAGAFAFGAWMLPGVSGSFILLMLGVWAPILTAVSGFKWVVLCVFSLGLITGWLVFSNLVRYLLEYHKHALIGVFSGLLLGSLWRLWPWRVADEPVLPWTSPDDAAYVVVIPAMLVGILIVSAPTLWTRALKQH